MASLSFRPAGDKLNSIVPGHVRDTGGQVEVGKERARATACLEDLSFTLDARVSPKSLLFFQAPGSVLTFSKAA